jgi:colanic acid biosynthesis protein WcaH
LVGKRNFDPAKHWFFVPGGRILKDERIRDAFARITRTELGADMCIGDARFLGVYEHFYPTNRFEKEGFGTHYVVLAYEVELGEFQRVQLNDQHSTYEWIKEEELLARGNIHEHVKAYFRRTVL